MEGGASTCGRPQGSTHHYLVTVNDGVQSVCDGEHCALGKLLPDFLLY